MSKTDKLNRMKNTVLETTGLTYTPGGTIELNFTPDVTNSGVSVPLVTGGSSSVGVCSLFTNYTSVGGPGFGCPYAQIIDNTAANAEIFGGFSQALNVGNRGYYNSVISGGQATFTWRVRDMTNTVIDEIGVGPTDVGPSPASGISYDGKGSYFTLPVGVYYAKLYMTSSKVFESIGILFNSSKNEVLIAPYLNNYSWDNATYLQQITQVRGRFEIKDENDKILVLHARSFTNSTGVYYQNSSVVTNNYFNNIPLNLQLWKIR